MVSCVPMEIYYATSLDKDHPPSSIVDGDETTFWMTTGLYPQEVVVQFKKPCQIVRITTITGKAKFLRIYSATEKSMTEWLEIDSFQVPAQPIKLSETHQLNLQSTSYGLKVVIQQGWGPFTALYMLRVEGPTVREADDGPISTQEEG